MTKYFRIFITILIISFLTSSCKKDDFLSKDEKEALFVEPTTTEIDDIYYDWKNRDLTPTDYTVISENEILEGMDLLQKTGG
jgi:hypothetical protein